MTGDVEDHVFLYGTAYMLVKLQSVQWRKSPASVGDHQSTQLFLSETKQRYIFNRKKVSAMWQQVI